MESELKKVKLNMVMLDETRLMVTAYTCPVAGIVITSLRDKVLYKGSYIVIKRNNNWVIWAYPVGLRILGGFPTREQALDFATTRLARYSWVALLVDDIRNTNDMDGMRQDFVGYRKEIEAMRKAVGL